MRPHRLLAFCTSVAVLAACASASSSTGPSGGTPINIAKVSGDSQSDPYGATVTQPLVVKVTNQAGSPVGGASVAWLTALDGGLAPIEITTTDADGKAQWSPMLGDLPGAFATTAAINGANVVFSGISNITLAGTVGTVQASLFANCGISTTGPAFCWGNGFGGELGNGLTGAHAGPVPVSGTNTYKQIGVSSAIACGLATDGTLYCWGDPAYGQMGNGSAPTGGIIATPTAAGNGRTFTQIAVGEGQSCGISAGVSYCWGAFNSIGALGTGDSSPHYAPTAVKVPVGVSVTSITGGSSFDCALTSSGATYCWGNNFSGQLGIGSTTPHSSPSPVAVSGGLSFVALAAGATGMCGLTSGGAAYCWGQGVNGNGVAGNTSAPTAVQGGITFKQISAGGQHACGLTAAGAAYCWGDNDHGDLGSGSLGGPSYSPVAVTGGHTFSVILAGGLSTCGYTTSHVMYCWGNNTSQQLGLDATADTMYAVPTKVPGMAGN